MDIYTATEEAYKKGYEDGKQNGVIRCKDCKWYKESKYLAPIKFCYRLKDSNGEHIGYNFSDYDFCSRGERRTESFEEDLSDGALD